MRTIETDGQELVVVRRSDLDLATDEKARRLAYLDNRASELGLEWDVEQMLADLEGGRGSLRHLRASGARRAAWRTREGRALADPDEVPPLPAEPVSRRAISGSAAISACSAATRPPSEDVERLLDGGHPGCW